MILLVLLLSLAVVPGWAQAPRLPGSESDFLQWMGHQPGDVLAYDMGGIHSCPRVGDPITIDGRRYAPIEEFEWQGPKRILIPLDGSIALSSAPAETSDSVFDSLFYSPSLTWADSLEPALEDSRFRDGWVAVGTAGSSPRYLIYRWCTSCFHAGATVVLERGKGISWMDWTTYLGMARITRADRSMCERAGARCSCVTELTLA